ncbi:MAG: polysaccharide deacetylase family protein [Eubacteriales bacterium]|nr:polysaccharide deacetylase family protein [Eubacteriales bacterium]
MKIMSSGIKTLAIAAVFAITASFSAFADGVIIAPGVTLPGQVSEAPGPGPGSGPVSVIEADAPGQDVSNNVSDSNVSNNIVTEPTAPAAVEPAAPAVTEPSAPADGTGQAVPAADTDSLIAQSLANPYTIYNSSEANIVISRGRKIDITRPMIALTYDDGPQTTVGNRIMDIFEQYGQRTTFFMVGDRIPSRAAEVKRMAADGHEVANHTYSHTYLNKVGADTIRSQVVKCNDVIEQTTGIRPRIMRLPGGNKNSTVLANVNMPIILWSIDTRDWDHRNAAKSEAAIMGKVKDGDIVLMHELYSATADATASVVPQLVNQGFQLVTVSEMAEIKGISLTANKVYYSF